MSLKDYPLVSDWLSASGGTLVVHTGKVDIGQRISTALAQIAHEELTVPLSQIDVAPVRTGHAPDEGITSGSNSIEQSGHALRKAAATLREVLRATLAEKGESAPEDWSLSDGNFTHKGTNLPFRVIDLMDRIAPDLPVDSEAQALPAQATAPCVPMRGLDRMVTGRFTFVHDLEVAGMVHARPVHPPHARARLTDLPQDTAQRLNDSGLRIIRDGSFLAVVGPSEWQVVKAALRLAAACTWEDHGGLSERDVFADLTAEKATRLTVTDGVPRHSAVPEPLDAPDFTARYERPYLMHGALAPSAAMALWSGERLTIQCHSQGIYPLRDSIADSLGLATGQIEITHCPGSGCYGHNGADDAAFEAALVAMALPDTPVLLKWTREDEHGWEPYAPAMAVDVAVSMSNDHIAALSAEVFSDTHRGRPRPGPNRAGPSRLLANGLRASSIPAAPALPNMNTHGGMHRNLDPVYRIANKRLVKNLIGGMVHRTSALRCLGATTNVFALESTMEDLAGQRGLDPVAFRRAHLDDPRAASVLDELETRMTATPRPRGEAIGRGIAYAQYKNTMTRVGVCVDIAVTDLGQIRLKNAIIVADAGRVIDEDGLRAQLEGGFIQGASWALFEEVKWTRDGILSRDWQSYPVIRFDDIPAIEVVILNRPEAKSVGAGEASPGPAIAAIANALYDATGLRLRRLPFTADAVLRQAVAE